MTMNRAISTALIPLCALTIAGCTQTTEGSAVAGTGHVNTASPSRTTTTSPTTTSTTASLTLPEQLDTFIPTSPEELSQRTTQEVAEIARSSSVHMWDLLGTELGSPVLIPRTVQGGCLSDATAHAEAVYCNKRIEYRDDLITEKRERYGDLYPVLIIAHEVGHVLSAATGTNDGVSVEVSEQRANCAAGAFLSTIPSMTAREAGTLFQESTLTEAGQGSYTAFRAGFDLTRSGVNPTQQCAHYQD
ncbi:hypothetical protein P5W04_10305 [Mycobacteroides abscessus subsp. abscessus]|uniref:hypothetical protein n=1 Tax=Mycobacteroides abscessus TaxID=36809 RepID=UPI000E6A16FD|nr:hypothetical protein [Mycobacteroides abscessus]MBN7484553.1 hypothetical protein [Mycobacteroides abscessus subsp. abscessus]MDO3240506.1 hypothetical protein [Mycobacteroides abscessus subsp. abscessus]RIT75000.1 hypothetical protein D2E77_01575 [Mycobacteroides abscessus]